MNAPELPIVQPVALHRCGSCNRWAGPRRIGSTPGTVEFEGENPEGECVEGPWHGNVRRHKNACGRWIQWLALESG